MKVEYINTKEAEKLVKFYTGRNVTKTTMYNWIRNYNLGYKMGGRWMFREKLLIKFIKGEN